jgi:hypothetical protein
LREEVNEAKAEEPGRTPGGLRGLVCLAVPTHSVVRRQLSTWTSSDGLLAGERPSKTESVLT